MITSDPYGCLHSNGNNCTGKSQGLFAYRTSKGVMLINQQTPSFIFVTLVISITIESVSYSVIIYFICALICVNALNLLVRE